MANQITGCSAWKIDTPSASLLATGVGELQAIAWDNGTAGAADDHCEVQDGSGHTLFHAHAAAKDYTFNIAFPAGLVIRGVCVPTLTHGEVFLYWKHGRLPS